MTREFRRRDWVVPTHPTAGTAIPRSEVPEAEVGDRLILEYPGGEITARCTDIETWAHGNERSEWVAFEFDPPLDQQGLGPETQPGA